MSPADRAALLRGLEVVQPWLHGARTAYLLAMGATPEDWLHLSEQLDAATAIEHVCACQCSPAHTPEPTDPAIIVH